MVILEGRSVCPTRLAAAKPSGAAATVSSLPLPTDCFHLKQAYGTAAMLLLHPSLLHPSRPQRRPKQLHACSKTVAGAGCEAAPTNPRPKRRRWQSKVQIPSSAGLKSVLKLLTQVYQHLHNPTV